MPEERTPPSAPLYPSAVPTPARVYDYMLGGKDNYEVDRRAVDDIAGAVPHVIAAAHRQREFVLRAVRHMVAELGLDQIVDLCPGLPAHPTVHQVARAARPGTVVGYVDGDPNVLAHNRALVSVEPGTGTFVGALTGPAAVLDDPGLSGLVDWSRPIGLLMASGFNFVLDDDVALGTVDAYRRRIAPGSAVAISMLTSDGQDVQLVAEGMAAADRASQPVRLRTRKEIGRFFCGFRMVEPGLVALHEWRPTQLPRTPKEGGHVALAGVGLLDVG